MTCGIYLIKNNKTGQMYIGQSIDIERRFNEHCKKYNNELKIDKAINEYGQENFSLIIIERLPYTRDLLISQEKYWIKHFDTYENSFHYNNSPGGQYSVNKKSNIATIIKNGFRRGNRTYSISYQGKKFFRTESRLVLEEILEFFFDNNLKLLPKYTIDTFKKEGREFIKKNMGGQNAKFCLWYKIEEAGGIDFLRKEKKQGKTQFQIANNFNFSPHVIYNYLDDQGLCWGTL